MLEFEQAQALLADAGASRIVADIQRVPVQAALGRVLAENITATVDMPPADNSAMDGYAIRLADYVAGKPMPVQQRCYAGMAPLPLAAGQATRLFTGSVLPAGADTIVIQENCTEADGLVTIHEPPVRGEHVRYRAEDIARGAPLFTAGTVLGGGEIGVLAAQGLREVALYRRLRVGVLTTGDEVIEPDQVLQPHQVYNSNRPILASLVQGIGAELSLAVHANDDEAELSAALTQLAACSDIVLTAGGVSVGERDLVKPVLESLGGELELWKVRMKPGKPVALGRVGTVPVVCLPGNPVSVFAVFTVLVSPMLRRMQGRAALLPSTATAVLRTPVTQGDSRENFIRVQARTTEAGLLEVVPHRGQSSGIMNALPWADGLARIPAGASLGDGERVRYYAFANWLR